MWWKDIEGLRRAVKRRQRGAREQCGGAKGDDDVIER